MAVVFAVKAAPVLWLQTDVRGRKRLTLQGEKTQNDKDGVKKGKRGSLVLQTRKKLLGLKQQIATNQFYYQIVF